MRGFKIHMVLPDLGEGSVCLVIAEHSEAPTERQVLLEICGGPERYAGRVMGARVAGVLGRVLRMTMGGQSVHAELGCGAHDLFGVGLEYVRGKHCRLSIREGGDVEGEPLWIDLDPADIRDIIDVLHDIEGAWRKRRSRKADRPEAAQ